MQRTSGSCGLSLFMKFPLSARSHAPQSLPAAAGQPSLILFSLDAMNVSPFLRVFALTILLLISVGRFAHAQRPDDLAKIAVKVVPPEYPYEARRSGITGKGVLVAEVDYKSGKVTSVKM